MKRVLAWGWGGKSPQTVGWWRRRGEGEGKKVRGVEGERGSRGWGGEREGLSSRVRQSQLLMCDSQPLSLSCDTTDRV